MSVEPPITTYDHPDFSKSVAQELLKELQNSQSLDDGYNIIHNAIEYVKSNEIQTVNYQKISVEFIRFQHIHHFKYLR